jgi:hypothetical protein
MPLYGAFFHLDGVSCYHDKADLMKNDYGRSPKHLKLFAAFPLGIAEGNLSL